MQHLGRTHLCLLLGESDVGAVLGIKINADEATDCIHQAEKIEDLLKQKVTR